MKSKWLPTFPLHAANWLADPRVQMLKPVAKSQLLEALLRSWMLGKAIEVPAIIAQSYGELWPEYEAVLHEHNALREKRAELGKLGNDKRWGSQKGSQLRSQKGSPGDRTRVHRTPTPTPTPTSTLTQTGTQPVVGRRGSRLPDDAVLTGEWVEIAERHGVRDVDSVFVEFVNYWTSLPGQKATKLDWTKTWENQCIKVGRPGRSERPRTAAAETMSNVREFLEDSGAAFGR